MSLTKPPFGGPGTRVRSLANSTRYDQALSDLSKLRRIQGTELNEDPKAESFVKSILALVNDVILLKNYLEPQTTIYKWMFGETTISYVKIGNHPIETTIYKWLFGVPGTSVTSSRKEAASILQLHFIFVGMCYVCVCVFFVLFCLRLFFCFSCEIFFPLFVRMIREPDESRPILLVKFLLDLMHAYILELLTEDLVDKT